MLGVRKGERVAMGAMELRAISLLSKCRFGRGGWDFGFVASLADLKARGFMWISPKQKEHLWRLVRLYHKQIGDAELVKHAQQVGSGGAGEGVECPNCK